MAYTRQTWSNGRSGATPISAARLNNMELGIYNAARIADTANTTAGGHTSQISTINTNVSNLTSRVTALEEDSGGGASLSSDLFVNDGVVTVANNAWTLGVPYAADPRATAAGNVTLHSNKSYLKVNTAGLYFVFYTIVDTANPTGQDNNLNDLQLMTTVGGSVTATKARFTFKGTNQGSSAAAVFFDAGSLVRLAIRQNATGGSFSLPDGVAGANTGGYIGSAISFIKVG